MITNVPTTNSMHSDEQALRLVAGSHRLLGWIGALGGALLLFFALMGLRFAPKDFTSNAEMIVGNKLSMPEGSVYQEELSNFIGTQAALMQSRLVTTRARNRLMAQKPDLVPVPLRLHVSVLPKTTIFQLQASSDSPEYTQAFLQACMDEYILLKKEMRAQTSNLTVAGLTTEALRMEQELQKTDDQLRRFVVTNSIVLLQEEAALYQRQYAAFLQKIIDLKTEFDLLPSQEQAAEKRNALQSQISALERKLVQSAAHHADISRKTGEYQKIKASAANIQTLYDRVLGTLQTLDVNREINPETVTILEKATPPDRLVQSWLAFLLRNRAGPAAVIGLAIACLMFFTARCLERRRHLSYCLVVASLECLALPVGTVLGVFTLLILWRTVRQNSPLQPCPTEAHSSDPDPLL